jgi:polyisoprenoid-binding protein YceI
MASHAHVRLQVPQIDVYSALALWRHPLLIGSTTSEADRLSTQDASPSIFDVSPGRSAVLIKARSNVGPISFATSEVAGSFSACVRDHQVEVADILEGQLSVSLKGLTSGNNLYDAELRRRIDTRRHPAAILELKTAVRIDGTSRYELTSSIEFHNVTRTIGGVVSIEVSKDNTLVIRGEQILDVRDFNLETPTTLALKIYPDVWVEMHLEGIARK